MTDAEKTRLMEGLTEEQQAEVQAKIASGMALSAEFAWVNLANVPVPMTAESFKALTQAIFDWTQNVFAASLQAKAAVNALTTVAAVQAYVIPAWPTA